jgi:hypothetical protein
METAEMLVHLHATQYNSMQYTVNKSFRRKNPRQQSYVSYSWLADVERKLQLNWYDFMSV